MIRTEKPEDHSAVGELHALAFGRGERVPALVNALRQLPRCISLVAVADAGDDAETGVETGATADRPGTHRVVDGAVDGVVVGHVMLTVCRVDAWPRLVDVYSLSPLGVHPDWQRRGYGTALVAAALREADACGMPMVFLEGSAAYYGARGFERASAAGFQAPSLRMPDPGFQVAKLSAYEPWMTGAFVYAEAFWNHDCVGIRDPERFARIIGL